ncbi:DUF4282 domain-containing protein [Chlorobium phaeovibrioides]|uniref:DUF4282 domain-containing protein n=2 Tax=Chlorobium phaeovibrioides TaxID=1094 RepID=UPI001CB92FE8|nr:DUF4282 domain-containing protein [Chlorobium phaeovibrioides]
MLPYLWYLEIEVPSFFTLRIGYNSQQFCGSFSQFNSEHKELTMQNGSLFGKLFDFSFKEFITLQIVKYLYILSMVFAAITALGTLGAGFTSMQFNFWSGLGGILMAPIVFFLLVLLARLLLEALVATFRIAENTSILVEKK